MPTIPGLPRIGIGKVRIGALVSLKPPTLLTSSFTVDTILGQLNWTNNAGADAQFEVYGSTNGAAETLLATTIAGVTYYQDLTCKQNASVVYRIRVKKGAKFSEYVSATALLTPLCWKTNQSVLTAVNISQLDLTTGKSITINWGDGISNTYVGTGGVATATKNYSVTGIYNISISGDTDYILKFNHSAQSKSSGNLTNWVLPKTLATFYVNATSFTGKSPILQPNNIGSLYYSAQACFFSDCDVIEFRKTMTIFDLSNQNVIFPTVNINKVLKALADYYQVNISSANCTINMSGANMGIPTGGSSNADITRLVGYYTAAGKSCTVLVRTS